MKKLCALGLSVGASFALTHAVSASTLIYEPFDYTAGSTIVPGNVSINSGNGLVDTYNTPSTKWVQAGAFTTGTTPHQIASSGLVAPAGFTAATGNAAILEGGASGRSDQTEMARMDLPGGPYGTSAVTYYSLLLNVNDLSGLTTAHTNANANNDLIIALNNSSGANATRPSLWAGELTIRLGLDSSHYNLGIRASSTAANTTYWSGELAPGDTHLVVVRFTEGATAGTGGLSELWIDPNASTYNALTAPTADGSTVGTYSATPTNDHTNSVIIGAGVANNANPNQTTIDELRVGTSWADVVVPEPTSLGLAAIAGFGILSRRRRVA